jgi:hypothetical protein
VAPRHPSGFQAGVSLVYYARQISDPAVKVPPLLDRLDRDHVNSISIVFPIYTDGVNANTVHAGPDTPSDAALSYLVGQAHSRGMAVMLRPLLDEANLPPPYWRGSIQPASVGGWFDGYQSLTVHYGALAQTLRVETFNVGSELNSMEAYPNSWRRLIDAVRATYKGSVTYSSNWQGYTTAFWGALDFISFDAYFPLDAASPTMSDLALAWTPALDEIGRATASFGKSVVFTEVGVQARANAYRTPWVRNPGAPLDLAEQAAYYGGTCQRTRGVVGGLYWWDVYLQAPADPLHDGDYTPLGKPAEDAMRRCFAAGS